MFAFFSQLTERIREPDGIFAFAPGRGRSSLKLDPLETKPIVMYGPLGQIRLSAFKGKFEQCFQCRPTRSSCLSRAK